MSKRVTTNDPVTALKWAAAFDDHRPITIEGKEYLLLELTTVSGFHPVFPFSGASALAEEYVIAGAPGMSAFRAKEALKVDLSNPPAGATHYHPQDEKHPFRKLVSGIRFAWVAPFGWTRCTSHDQPATWERLPVSPSNVELTVDFINEDLLDVRGGDWPQQRYVGPFPPCPPTRCATVPINASFNFSGTVTGRDESTAEAPKPQWDGTGLPPVDVECEALRLGTWIKCKVFAHRFGRALFDFDGGWGDSDEPARFRPIKTAEQLEAEKRAAEIDRIATAFRAQLVGWGLGFPSFKTSAASAAKLYDAGVRFPAEDK